MASLRLWVTPALVSGAPLLVARLRDRFQIDYLPLCHTRIHTLLSKDRHLAIVTKSSGSTRLLSRWALGDWGVYAGRLRIISRSRAPGPSSGVTGIVARILGLGIPHIFLLPYDRAHPPSDLLPLSPPALGAVSVNESPISGFGRHRLIHGLQV